MTTPHQHIHMSVLYHARRTRPCSTGGVGAATLMNAAAAVYAFGADQSPNGCCCSPAATWLVVLDPRLCVRARGGGGARPAC
jgi:hypothetical protein